MMASAPAGGSGIAPRRGLCRVAAAVGMGGIFLDQLHLVAFGCIFCVLALGMGAVISHFGVEMGGICLDLSHLVAS